MRILIVGGYGLIGGYVLARLAMDGHELVGAGRDVAEATRRFPAVRWIKLDLADGDPAAWSQALRGVDVVVNCAGALQNGGRDNLRAVHVDGLTVLVESVGLAGVKRLVHISAAGLETSPGAFGATKRAGEAMLATTELDWIVLRPGLVLAPNAFGGSALLRGLAAFPFLIPATHLDRPVQVASARDIAEAVAAAIKPEAPKRIAIDLVAERETSLAELLPALRAWLGAPAAPVVRAPNWATWIVAGLADTLACLGWRSPLRTTAIAQLASGVRGTAGQAESLLGVGMRSLAEILSDNPSGVQERWFARLYWLKPVCFLTLAIFWTVSGLVGLLHPDRAAAVLVSGGVPAGPANVAAVAGSLIDMLLGLLICHRRSAPIALIGMLVVSASYVLGASIWRPDLWADPLGPLVKILPSIVLVLVAFALLPER